VCCSLLERTTAQRNTRRALTPPERDVCCSVLQCVAVCCSVLQSIHTEDRTKEHPPPRTNFPKRGICCSALQCTVVCCGVLRCVAVCCGALQCVAANSSVLQSNQKGRQRAAVCCSVLQCAKVCCSVLQFVAVYQKGRQDKGAPAATHKLLRKERNRPLFWYLLRSAFTQTVAQILRFGLHLILRPIHYLCVCVCVCACEGVCVCER